MDLPADADVSLAVTAGKDLQDENGAQTAENNGKDYDGVIQDFTAGVEHISSLHRQTMYGIAGGKPYAWYETQVKFNEQLTQNNLDDVHVTDVTNIFQTIDEDRGPLCQTITSNVVKGMLIPAAIPDVWIEDYDLSKFVIKLTIEDVLDKLKTWNGEIPSSKGIVLRAPVGPLPCNAQYVIGNIQTAIFIDAVTGDISEWCPAFPEPKTK